MNGWLPVVSLRKKGEGGSEKEIACFIEQVPLSSFVFHQNLSFFDMKTFREDAINFLGSRSRVTKQEVDPSLK